MAPQVEGYNCVAEGKRIRLLLYDDLEGPTVGQVQADGSVAVDIDEWAQELYHARPCRGRGHVPKEVDAFLTKGRPYIWDDFASSEEVLAAHKELERLNQRLGRLDFLDLKPEIDRTRSKTR